MTNEYLWHYNDDEYLSFAKQYIKELIQNETISIPIEINLKQYTGEVIGNVS